MYFGILTSNKKTAVFFFNDLYVVVLLAPVPPQGEAAVSQTLPIRPLHFRLMPTHFLISATYKQIKERIGSC